MGELLIDQRRIGLMTVGRRVWLDLILIKIRYTTLGAAKERAAETAMTRNRNVRFTRCSRTMRGHRIAPGSGRRDCILIMLWVFGPN
jgi:hypothetical protein